MLTGHITDAVTGEPVVATIFIKDIDDSGEGREPYKSNSSFGTYYRLLKHGEYEITISADGYYPQTFSGIEILKNDITILGVALQPIATNISNNSDMDHAGSKLQIKRMRHGVITIQLPGINSMGLVTIYNAKGHLVQTFNSTGSSKGIQLISWNTSQFPSGMYLIRAEVNSNQSVVRYMLSK